MEEKYKCTVGVYVEVNMSDLQVRGNFFFSFFFFVKNINIKSHIKPLEYKVLHNVQK